MLHQGLFIQKVGADKAESLVASKRRPAKSWPAQVVSQNALRVGITLAKGKGREQVSSMLQGQLHKPQALPEIHHLLACITVHGSAYRHGAKP